MASSVVCSTDADDDWRKKNQSRVVIEKENRITFIGKRSFNANQSEPVLTEKNDSQVLEEQPIDRNRIVFFFSFSNQSRKRAACCRAVLLDCSPVFCPVERKNKEVKRKSIPRQKVKKSPTPKRDPDETNEKDIATGNRMAREGQPVAAILGPANAQANAKKKKRNKWNEMKRNQKQTNKTKKRTRKETRTTLLASSEFGFSFVFFCLFEKETKQLGTLLLAGFFSLHFYHFPPRHSIRILSLLREEKKANQDKKN